MSADKANIDILKRIIEFEQRGAAIFSQNGEGSDLSTDDITMIATNPVFDRMVNSVPSKSEQNLSALIEKVLVCFRGGCDHEHELSLIKGELFYLATAKLINLGSYVICYLSDNQKVSETPEFALKMLEKTSDMVAVIDTSYRYVVFNAPYKNEIKQAYNIDLQPGMTLNDAVGDNEEDYAKALPAWQTAIEGKEIKAEGSFGSTESILYEYTFNPIIDESGKVSLAILTVRNISRYRQLELESIDRGKLQALLNQSPDLIVKLDPSLTCQYVNGSIQRFGIGYDKILGKSFHDLNIPDRVRENFMPYFQAVFQGKRTEIFDTFKIKGHNYDLHIIFIPQTDEKGEVSSAIITCHDLTALNTLKQKFRAIFDGTFQFIGLMDKNGKVLEANKTALDFIQADINELAGKYVWDTPWFFGEENINLLKVAVARAANGEFVRHNIPIHDHRGHVTTIDFSLKPVYNEQGEIIWLLPEGRDISELIEAEKRLEEMGEFTFMADNLPHMLWTADKQGTVQYANQTFLSVTGLTPNDIEDGGLRYKMLHPEERDEVYKKWQQALETEEPLSVQHRIIRHSGEYAWYHTRVHPMKDINGNVVKWHGSAFDIDELKRTSLALNNMNHRLQEMTDAMPVIVWTADRHGITDSFNKRWRDYTGIEVEDSIRFGWKNAVHPEDLAELIDFWKDKIRDRTAFQAEYRLRDRNGMYRWFLEEGKPIFDEEGEVSLWIGTATDIQEQYDASQLMALKAEEFQTMAETIPQVVWTADNQGNFLFLSNKWKEWTGTEIDNSLNRDWLLCVAEEDRENVRRKYEECVREGIPFISEFRLADMHGSRFWVLGMCLPARQEGKVTRWFGTFTDISIQKEVEEYKDAFLRIAGHELRTPLTSLMATLGLLKRLPLNDPDFPGYLQKSYDASVKLKNLITDLLDISTSVKAKFSYHDEPFSLDNLLDELVESLSQTIKTHQIVLSGETHATIRADRVRMEQVFNNLLQNAFKYSPDGDDIRVIRTATDDEAIVKITDRGMGIDDSDKDHIFKKFYRAEKHSSIRGMGLGLYLAKSIVNHYGGSITVESKPGEGSVFTVRIKK